MPCGLRKQLGKRREASDLFVTIRVTQNRSALSARVGLVPEFYVGEFGIFCHGARWIDNGAPFRRSLTVVVIVAAGEERGAHNL